MHPTPWTIAWHDPGESMGYSSRSKIVDASGSLVVLIYTGNRNRDEQLAERIVFAINGSEK